MKINLTEELNKLVTDDLIQFAKGGKKLVAKTKKMEVGGGFLSVRRNENNKSLPDKEKKPSGIGTVSGPSENNKSLPDKEKKPSGIGTDLGPSEMVEVPVEHTIGVYEKHGTAAARWRSNLNPGDSTIVPISRVLDQYKIGAKRVKQ